MSSVPPDRPDVAAPLSFREVQASEEFVDLRRRFRRFAFPMTAFFLIWYFSYVILAAYFHDFMSIRVFGNINIGLLLGLGQFVTTFGITMIYVRWADREFDPRADAIRERMEAGGGQR